MSLTGKLNGEHAEQRERTIVTRAAPSASRVVADGALNYLTALHLRLSFVSPRGFNDLYPTERALFSPALHFRLFSYGLSNCQPSRSQRYTKLRQQRTAGVQANWI